MFGITSKDPSEKTPEQTVTVVQLIADQVRNDISFGVLTPDKTLDITSLRQHYGGNAETMYQVLLLLSMEGIVESTTKKEFRVASATEQDLEDLIRVRIEIESLALKWSMDNGNLLWQNLIIAAQQSLESTTLHVVQNPQAYALDWDEYHRHFHDCLINACNSPRLIAMQQQLLQQSRRFHIKRLRDGLINFEQYNAQLNQLVTAIQAQQPENALCSLKKMIQLLYH